MPGALPKVAKTTYHYYTDPGHGWLAVKRSELDRLGIANKISPYSYQRGDTVYLEEDMDMTTFLLIKKQMGEFVNMSEIYQENTPIRHYEQYRFLLK